MNTLSELSSYVYLLGNDARILHLYTKELIGILHSVMLLIQTLL